MLEATGLIKVISMTVSKITKQIICYKFHDLPVKGGLIAESFSILKENVALGTSHTNKQISQFVFRISSPTDVMKKENLKFLAYLILV